MMVSDGQVNLRRFSLLIKDSVSKDVLAQALQVHFPSGEVKIEETKPELNEGMILEFLDKMSEKNQIVENFTQAYHSRKITYEGLIINIIFQLLKERDEMLIGMLNYSIRSIYLG